ncbi:MAG: hypothetical protein M3Q91_17920, partial [Acidobacteriota bacterium]|nr:hypothetical protein [Acidobacteriota bacterium]
NRERDKDDLIEKQHAQILLLEAQVAELRAALNPTRESSHEKARKAEQFIAELLGCEFAPHVARHDLLAVKSGIKFEVKFSSLTYPKGRTSSIRYWLWTAIFGEKDGKIFDHLILVGQSDSEYREIYVEPDSPFVLFDLSYSETLSFLNNHGDIQLNTNPNGLRKPVFKLLYKEHQITRNQLCLRYRDDSRE